MAIWCQSHATVPTGQGNYVIISIYTDSVGVVVLVITFMMNAISVVSHCLIPVS